MKPKDLIRALGAADPSDIEAAAPNVHRRDQTPDISAVLDTIRAEQEDGCTAARIEICENKEHRRGLVPVLLGACSMAACALIVAGMAYVLHDNSRLPMTASNVAADVTEITAATETTAAETTIVLITDTTTTVTADGMGLHTLPYVRTTAPRDPSAEPADAIETEPPENPDAPKQLPVFIEPEQVVVPVTSATTTTATTPEMSRIITATLPAGEESWQDVIRKHVKNAKFSAPSFVMQFEDDQNKGIDDALRFDELTNWSSWIKQEKRLNHLTYAQENDGYRMLMENNDIPLVIWFKFKADGYIPEVREVKTNGDSGGVVFSLALVPADVHGIVRVYLPDINALPDLEWEYFWRTWQYEVIGTDTEQNTPPKMTYEEATETEVLPMD